MFFGDPLSKLETSVCFFVIVYQEMFNNICFKNMKQTLYGFWGPSVKIRDVCMFFFVIVHQEMLNNICFKNIKFLRGSYQPIVPR